MAGEVVGKENQSGFGSVVERDRDPSRSYEFRREVYEILDEFVDEHISEFDPKKLDFFTDPQFQKYSDELNKEIRPDEEEYQGLKEITNQMIRSFSELEDDIEEDDIEEALEKINDLEDDVRPYVSISPACSEDMESLVEDARSLAITDEE